MAKLSSFLVKTFVKSVQNQLLSSKICPENSHKIGCLYQSFSAKSAPKRFRKFPTKLAVFIRRFVYENPMKCDFFCDLGKISKTLNLVILILLLPGQYRDFPVKTSLSNESSSGAFAITCLFCQHHSPQ